MAQLIPEVAEKLDIEPAKGTDSEEARRATDLLTNRYTQYRSKRPEGPVVAVLIDRLTGWSGA